MKTKNMLFVLVIVLCASLLFITVGFSAMSTTLTIDGYAYFEPVDMLRVISLKKDTFYNATETKSNFKIDGISTLLTIDEVDGYAIYDVTITNLGEVNKVLSNVEKVIYSNENIGYEFDGFGINDVIKAKETKNFKVKFYLKSGADIRDNRLNAEFRFIFDDYVYVPTVHNYDYYASTCTFNGKGVNVSGSCNNGDDIVITDIKPFSEENYQKNFILTLTLTDIDDSRLVSGKQDTFMNMLYEANNTSYGKYPGLLFRVEDKMLNLHASNGQFSSDYAVDKKFSKSEILNKELKVIRYNDGSSIKLYYSVDGNGPYLLMDITNLYKPFDTPLSFGASPAVDHINKDRYAIGTMENMSFRFVSTEEVQKEFNKTIADDINFELMNTCTFNGNDNIVGCSNYSNTNYINTGIYLFDKANYERDFDLSFTLSNYDSNSQNESQVTIMNAFLERTGKGYGILIRRANNNLNLIIRDGNGLEKSVMFSPNQTNNIRIVKQNNRVCYSINNSELKYAISLANFAEPFNVPVTFGSSIDSSGKPFRYIKGDISDMHIKVGQIDPNIRCGN